MAKTTDHPLRIVLTLMLLTLCAACESAKLEPLPDPAKSYLVLSSVASPEVGSVTVKIRVVGPLTEARVKAVAEAAIAPHRGQFQSIIVESYIGKGQPNELPYAVSSLENGQLAHRINAQAVPQKIPTH